MMLTFDRTDYQELCRRLAMNDEDIRRVIDTYGYPPLWSRPNTYESLVHIILEQQVSLASALAALRRLQARLGAITPQGVLGLSESELKICYVSRQKAGYIQNLARKLMSNELDLHKLETLPDAAIRKILIELKGVGEWTVDIYLIMVLHRADVFPVGDIAARNALKSLKGLSADTSYEDLVTVADSYRPYRSVATTLLWHYYLSKLNRR